MNTPDKVTHAGGVVCRVRDGKVEYLLVGPKNEVPGEWLLPKGHIEKGETAAEAAVREMREEAGIVARPLDLAGQDQFTVNDGQVVVSYYLMEGVGEAKR